MKKTTWTKLNWSRRPCPPRANPSAADAAAPVPLPAHAGESQPDSISPLGANSWERSKVVDVLLWESSQGCAFTGLCWAREAELKWGVLWQSRLWLCTSGPTLQASVVVAAGVFRIMFTSFLMSSQKTVLRICWEFQIVYHIVSTGVVIKLALPFTVIVWVRILSLIHISEPTRH